MKHNLTTVLKNVGAESHITPDERERLSRTVSEYVSLKPAMHSARSARSSAHLFSFISFAGVRPLVSALAVMVIVSGAGVSYAAEQAVPGDTLYPIKVRVNEPIRAAFIVDRNDRLAWESERAERRLEEVVVLAHRGRLDGDTARHLEKEFVLHAERVLSESGASVDEFDAPIAFEARLRARSLYLERKGLADASTLAAVREYTDRLNESRFHSGGRVAQNSDATSASLARKSAAPAPMPEPAAFTVSIESASVPNEEVRDEYDESDMRVLERAAKRSHEAYETAAKLLEKRSARIPSDELAEIHTLIAESRNHLDEAQSLTVQGLFGDALQAHEASHDISWRAVVLIKTAVTLSREQ